MYYYNLKYDLPLYYFYINKNIKKAFNYKRKIYLYDFLQMIYYFYIYVCILKKKNNIGA